MFSTMVVVGDGSVGSLTVQLGENPNGIYFRDIDGLDPVKATLTSSNFAGQTGAVFQSSRRETRNIVIKFGIEPDPATQTVRSVRKSIYTIFRPETEILLKFYDDESTDVSDGYQIVGRVETCGPPTSRFSQDSEVDISILCFDPDFQDSTPVNITGISSSDPGPAEITYEGTTETGIIYTFTINDAVDEIGIHYTDGTNVTQVMDIAATFITGDVVTINTTPGSKSASLLRAGIVTSILYAVSPQSIWMQLTPGYGKFEFYASVPVPIAISYTKRFGEV